MYARSRQSILDLFRSSKPLGWLQGQMEFEVTIRKITGSTKLKCFEFSMDLPCKEAVSLMKRNSL